MENLNEVVNEGETPDPVTEGKVDNIEETNPPGKPGEKTDPALLLESLKIEKEKRRLSDEKARLAEEKLNELESSNLSEEVESDEGKALDSKISQVESKLKTLEKDNLKKDVLIANPVLKEHLSEFEDYLEEPDNKGMNIKTAAKAFITERGLVTTPRKGLEKTTGGDKTAPSTPGMTADEAANLRKTDFKRYQQMIMDNQLIIKD